MIGICSIVACIATWGGVRMGVGLLGIVPYRGVTRLIINNLIIELELETELVLGPKHNLNKPRPRRTPPQNVGGH